MFKLDRSISGKGVKVKVYNPKPKPAKGRNLWQVRLEYKGRKHDTNFLYPLGKAPSEQTVFDHFLFVTILPNDYKQYCLDFKLEDTPETKRRFKKDMRDANGVRKVLGSDYESFLKFLSF